MPENALGFGLRSRARRPSAVPTREALEAVLYDKAYSWELQPGSDVMATCVGVLPLAFHTSGGRPVWAGLVTIDHALTADEANASVPGFEGMAVLAADTPLTVDGYNDGVFPSAGAPAGVYVAMADISNITGGQPPYAFPAGWTPGNTTGSGPVVPLIGAGSSGADHYAGLVTVDAGFSFPGGQNYVMVGGDSQWFLVPATATLTVDGLEDALYSSKVSAPVPNQVYLAVYYTAEGDTTPTALPTGWTFRPYGIGPIAITDENAGGLIGDIAYVVSGYVDNTDQAMAALSGGAFHGFAEYESSITMQADDTFKSPNDSLTYRAVTSGVVVFNTMALDEEATTTELELATAVDYWPFIERYDLAAKKWLPRIPLPDLGEGNYFSTEGGIAGVIDGKLYFGGGDGDVVTGNEFFVYDPADDSITRLADLDEFNYPDYNTYWTLNGKIWHWSYDGLVFVYDPATDTWTSFEPTLDIPEGMPPYRYARDQIQGFEVNGKMVMAYDGRAFVFDPETRTFSAKASITRSNGGGLQFLIDGKIHEFVGGQHVDPATYDPVADTWTIRTDLTNKAASDYDSEFVGVTHEGTPYLLSAIDTLGTGTDEGAGVYGLIDVGLDKPRTARLQDDKTPLDARIATAPVMFFKVSHGSGYITWPIYRGITQSFETYADIVSGAPVVNLCGFVTNAAGDPVHVGGPADFCYYVLDIENDDNSLHLHADPGIAIYTGILWDGVHATFDDAGRYLVRLTVTPSLTFFR